MFKYNFVWSSHHHVLTHYLSQTYFLIWVMKKKPQTNPLTPNSAVLETEQKEPRDEKKIKKKV